MQSEDSGYSANKAAREVYVPARGRDHSLVHGILRVLFGGESGNCEHFGFAVAISRFPEGLTLTKTSCTAIRFSVSVPVLSTQITVAAPSISMAGNCRVRTFLLRNTPGPNGHEDGQHQGKFFRDQGDGQGQRRNHSLGPVSAEQVHTIPATEATDQKAQYAEGAHQFGGFSFELRSLGSDAAQVWVPIFPISVPHPWRSRWQ